MPDVFDVSVCAPDGVAVGGYDVMTYWQDSGPLRGDPAITAIHDGVTYWFHSAAHRDRFVDSPERYLPKYRGWCSATLSAGRLACPDYTNYVIEEGELSLFEIVGFTNGRDVWLSAPGRHKRRADRNFRRFTELSAR